MVKLHLFLRSRIVNDLMWKHFPNTSVVQTLGNHEAVPRDFFIPPHMDEERTARPMAWLYDVGLM